MAYAFIAGNNWVETGGSTTLVFASQAYTAGDFVVVGITYGNGSAVTESIADGTNTYVKVGSTLNDASNGQNMAVFVCKSASSGTFTITVTFASAVTYRGIMYSRYSGLDSTATPVQAGNLVVNAGTGSNAITTGSMTPAAQPAMVFAFTVEDSGGGSALTAGTSFTDRGSMSNWDNYIGFSRYEDRRVTATSAVAGTFTASTGTYSYLTMGLVVIESGAAPGGNTFKRQSLLNGLGASGPFFNNPLG